MAIDYWSLLKDTSRTFYLSIRQLPGMTGEALCLSYLLLRVSDYLEDNPIMNPNQKAERLLLWGDMLNEGGKCDRLKDNLSGLLDGTADSQAAAHANELLCLVNNLPYPLQQTIRMHVYDSTLGMARWALRGSNVQTEEDMDDYMHEVAGRVGYLSTTIFAWQSKAVRDRIDRLMPLSRETGLALQTVNIIRGLRKDYERGWVYVPESFCEESHINRSDLFNPEYSEKALKVVDLLTNKADRHLKSAISYTILIPSSLHRIRLACIWPLCFAIRTLAISRHNLEVITGEVKITRPEVTKIVRDTTIFGWSNAWLLRYCQNLQRPQLMGAG